MFKTLDWKKKVSSRFHTKKILTVQYFSRKVSDSDQHQKPCEGLRQIHCPLATCVLSCHAVALRKPITTELFLVVGIELKKKITYILRPRSQS